MMFLRPAKSKTEGFTIIELLVASVVFSVVLVALLAVFIQISRLFYKGVNMSNTQNAARKVTDDIENDITFSATTPLSFTANGGTVSGKFCVGGHRYAYYLGQHVGSVSLAGIFRENFANSCPPLTGSGSVPVNTASADQLLDYGMQINYLKLSCLNGRCLIRVHLIFYGSSYAGLFGTTPSSPFSSSPWLAPDAECTGSLQSSQFCATADYTRTILQRV